MLKVILQVSDRVRIQTGGICLRFTVPQKSSLRNVQRQHDGGGRAQNRELLLCSFVAATHPL